jgi:lipid II isoglutaminyl synthase (glutamine-hydrolysing)
VLPERVARSAGPSALRIAWLYPDLLSTYGDRGNLLILTSRAMRRGIPAQPMEIRSDQPVPDQADIYLLGGGEDGPQALAASRLATDGGLQRALDRGAVLLAVCAGYQLVGESFFAKGEKCAGLGLVDLHSDRGPRRAVGELAGTANSALGLPTVTGFENHGGRTQLGPGVTPLASVSVGIGNDGKAEGVWAGRIIGTYMHGPVLARNPALADMLLRWAVGGSLATLSHVDDTWPTRLRDERLAAVRA